MASAANVGQRVGDRETRVALKVLATEVGGLSAQVGVLSGQVAALSGHVAASLVLVATGTVAGVTDVISAYNALVNKLVTAGLALAVDD